MGRSVGSSKFRRGKSQNQKRSNKNVKKTEPKEKKPPMHVVDLNLDCLSEIFGYLDISDLLSAAASSQRFNFVARDVFAQTFAKDVVTVTNAERTSAGRGRIPPVLLLTHFGDLVNKLKVDYCKILRRPHYELENAISKYCPVSAIEFKGCNNFAFSRIEKPLESVSEVRFTECHMGPLISKFNKLFPKARSLDVIYAATFTACIEQNFPQLDHLRIISSVNIGSTAIRAKLQSVLMATINLNPQLKSLTLIGRKTVFTSNDISFINEKLPLLDTLNIFVGRNTLAKRINFQNLRKLQLTFTFSIEISEFWITTRLPVELTLNCLHLSGDFGRFLSKNQNWKDITLNVLWFSFEDYEGFKNEIVQLKLLTSVEMSVNGLKGRENEVLELLNRCQFLKKFKIYSGHFCGTLVKFSKASEFMDAGIDFARLAKEYVDIFGNSKIETLNDYDTFLEVYRRAFEQNFENSHWLPKYEAKEEKVANYSWTVFSVQFEKQNFNGQ